MRSSIRQVRLLLSGKALSLPHNNSSDASVPGTTVKFFHVISPHNDTMRKEDVT